jgi:hypothetical protein
MQRIGPPDGVMAISDFLLILQMILVPCFISAGRSTFCLDATAQFTPAILHD